MPVMFLIFFGSDLSKMDQIWSNWISHQSENITIKSCHLYRKDKNDCFVFDFFGSKWIKLDQIGFLINLKKVTIKVVTFTDRMKMTILFLIFFWIRYVQNGSNLIKLDFLTNLKILLRIKMTILFLIFLDQICPKWIKFDQIGFLTNLKHYNKKLSHLHKG